MPQFAANLSWLYPHLPFLDRVAAAARDGFRAVECTFPYDRPLRVLQDRLNDVSMRLVLMNAPCGDWAAGERGLAALPDREADFRAALQQGADWAHALDCPRLHVLAGCPAPGADLATAWAVYEERLRWALDATQGSGLTLMIEPINAHDMPGYLLSEQAQAHAVVARIGSDRLKVQMDLYHCQRTEGDVLAQIQKWLPTGQVGHFQVAGVPDRGEPDQGELPALDAFALIDEISASTGWSGWIGCEYRPRRDPSQGGTSAGLDWLRPYQDAAV
ncbi:hydroxypyruvate isomerase family protein [Roseateles depolymerans]|uniref:Hydroxypyruvate isomerase n=1 Tax=Roseateles depolymerans TaxID=76731 RepID=A0A0U3LIX7_9BURK|nr:TIM barrel protein [Roseateles depolymerans]ALV08047.1 Hydroxypyruvate isomerase [Roseateles depolymerans]REG21732.1 hydroxypyruvate isomerase [Roseateles depolymerans]